MTPIFINEQVFFEVAPFFIADVGRSRLADEGGQYCYFRSWRIVLLWKFGSVFRDPRYAAFLEPSSPRFPHSSCTVTRQLPVPDPPATTLAPDAPLPRVENSPQRRMISTRSARVSRTRPLSAREVGSVVVFSFLYRHCGRRVTHTESAARKPGEAAFSQIRIAFFPFSFWRRILFIVSHAYTLVSFRHAGREGRVFHDELFKQAPRYA